MKKHRTAVLLLLVGGALAAVAAVYFLAQYGIGIPCLFNRLTGWLCPGCGNTRAALALLRLDLPGVFAYNPLFPLEFGYLLWVILRCCATYWRTGRFSYRPLWVWLDGAILVIVALWGVVRNII